MTQHTPLTVPFGMRLRWMLRALAITASLCASARTIAGVQPDPGYTIPFVMHGMHIFVQAKLNDMPVTMVLDSGASANVITPACFEKLGLKPTGAALVTGAGASAQAVKSVAIDRIECGKAITISKQPAYVIELPDALQCDGLLGTPFFMKWVVTIDYAAKKLILRNPDMAGTPPGEGFPLQFASGTVHIEGEVEGKKGLFKLDTGAGDALTLFGPFVERNGLRGKYHPSYRMVTGRGVGGLLYGDEVRLPQVKFGGFVLNGVASTLSTQTTGVFADARIAGNLGGELLQHFLVTFDEPHRMVYLAKGPTFDQPFFGNRSGMALDYSHGEIIVRSVIPQSPADEAGVKEGDIIVAINGRSAETLKPWEPREYFRRKVGDKITLSVKSGQLPARETRIVLREIL